MNERCNSALQADDCGSGLITTLSRFNRSTMSHPRQILDELVRISSNELV